jgi:hypothetical protein
MRRAPLADFREIDKTRNELEDQFAENLKIDTEPEPPIQIVTTF